MILTLSRIPIRRSASLVSSAIYRTANYQSLPAKKQQSHVKKSGYRERWRPQTNQPREDSTLHRTTYTFTLTTRPVFRCGHHRRDLRILQRRPSIPTISTSSQWSGSPIYISQRVSLHLFSHYLTLCERALCLVLKRDSYTAQGQERAITTQMSCTYVCD